MFLARGNAGRHNGVAGNIQVYIEEEPNDTFVRDGQNIIYNLLLDFPTAALGGQVDIPTIDGSNVKIRLNQEHSLVRRSAYMARVFQPYKVMAAVLVT